ncbi:uncharacterized protein LOC111702552 [Eurytemora carolleeae]|uniref:uncharacterized protein LOC111702552 n=1 Tax=Eurytemora carolleeae TaxID=1294199 RepID=UPI000C765147|nr:uncharacterized protein LOC111702552 [Eurytemora carolleeae]|eukprot:XP_023330049.1 uncharacterized protein LOC111702552 [Eurytemora affinis]
MKTIIFFCLIAIASARPGEQLNVEDVDVSWVAGSCLVEHWKDELDLKTNMENINACLDCWRKVGDPMTEDGLKKAKACVESQLPWEFQACADEVNSVELDNPEAVGPVLECFKNFRHEAGANYCLEKVEESEDPIDTLTDGSVCMLEFSKNVTMFQQYTRSSGSDRTGKKIKPGKESGEGKLLKQYVMGTLMPKAHCEVANIDDLDRQDACTKCFDDSIKADPVDVMKEIVACSDKYLLPAYQTCHDEFVSSLSGSGINNNSIVKCYIRTVLRYVVSTCNSDTDIEVNPESLLTTLDCGKDFIEDWIRENASDEFADEIIKKLEEDEENEYEEDEDEEDEENN